MSRRLVVALGALGLVVMGVAIAILVRSAPQPGPTPVPTPTTTNAPTETAMLVAVRDDTGMIADAVLMGTREAPVSGSWLSLIPGLSLDLNLDGEMTLALEGPWDPAETAASLGNQLGAKVTGGFVMDRLAFAAMVDAVGGVEVNSPVPIIEVSKTGQNVVVVKAGHRHLYGPAAAAYVTLLNPGERQASRMARFDEVWPQVILKLPGNSDRVRSVIVNLGSSSRTSMSPDAIANALLTYQTALTDRKTTSGTLPTQASGASVSAGPAVVYTMTPATAVPMVKSLFAESILVPGTDGALPRVRFYAAGAPDTAVVQAKDALFKAGMSFVWGSQYQPTPTSTVYLPVAGDQAGIGQRVTTALEIEATVFSVDPALTVGVQAAVVAGTNLFQPPASASPSTTGVATGTPKPVPTRVTP
ncbi:MAG: LCP family protein [Actinomycetes bacterium]